MPKPLFTRLAAICAVGLFCVLFGCVYALSQKDTILLVMSLLLGLCCIIRFILLYMLSRRKTTGFWKASASSGKNRLSHETSRYFFVLLTEKNTASAWKKTPGFLPDTVTGSILRRKALWEKTPEICCIHRL